MQQLYEEAVGWGCSYWWRLDVVVELLVAYPVYFNLLGRLAKVRNKRNRRQRHLVLVSARRYQPTAFEVIGRLRTVEFWGRGRVGSSRVVFPSTFMHNVCHETALLLAFELERLVAVSQIEQCIQTAPRNDQTSSLLVSLHGFPLCVDSEFPLI